MMRMAGSISKSTEVMKAMQNLIKLPEIQSSMIELSKEMAKVNIRSHDQNIKSHDQNIPVYCGHL